MRTQRAVPRIVHTRGHDPPRDGSVARSTDAPELAALSDFVDGESIRVLSRRPEKLVVLAQIETSWRLLGRELSERRQLSGLLVDRETRDAIVSAIRRVDEASVLRSFEPRARVSCRV